MRERGQQERGENEGDAATHKTTRCAHGGSISGFGGWPRGRADAGLYGLRASSASERHRDTVSSSAFRLDSAAYLDRTLPSSRGVRYLEDAKLFWPEEFPDVITEEARALWRTA